MRLRLCVVGITALLCLLPSPAQGAFHLEYVEGVEHGRTLTGIESAPQEPVQRFSAALVPRYLPRLGSVKERLVAAWPGDDEWMLRTVACESDFDAGATSPSGKHFGYFQMGPWARANYGDPRNQSVEEQAASAWALLRDEGSSQWVCSPWRIAAG